MWRHRGKYLWEDMWLQWAKQSIVYSVSDRPMQALKPDQMNGVTLHYNRYTQLQVYLCLCEPLNNIYYTAHWQSIAGSDPFTHLHEACYVISAKPNKRAVLHDYEKNQIITQPRDYRPLFWECSTGGVWDKVEDSCQAEYEYYDFYGPFLCVSPTIILFICSKNWCDFGKT